MASARGAGAAWRRRRSSSSSRPPPSSSPPLLRALPPLLLLLLLLLLFATVRGELLTEQPNCALKGGPLPPGIAPIAESGGAAAAAAGGCSIVLPQLARGDALVYEFDVAPKSAMSLLFVLRTRGGAVAMDLFYPTEDGGAADTASRAPDAAATRTRTASSSGEAWLAVPPAALAARPGRYALRLIGESGLPTVEVAVVTPDANVRLAAKERDALAALAKACCGGDGGAKKSPFCADVAPAALFSPADHPWQADFCHAAPPSVCDAKGRLVSLSLRDAGLRCPGGLPPQVAALPALERLDLSGNDLGGGGATAGAAAQTLAKSAAPLREVYLANARLGGALDCALAAPKRRVVDLTSNFIGGGVPRCLLDGGPIEELYVGRNELTGQLPAGDYASSALSALSAGSQRRPKGGLSGPLPPALLALSTLLYVNLAGNDHAGPLPALPPNARLFNVSGNSLTGKLPALPANLVALDVTANSFGDALPPLDAAPHLETLLGGSNAFSGALPAPLPPALARLDLSGNRLTGTLPASLPRLLRSLDLGSNRLEGDIGGLDVGGGALEELRLGNNSLTGWVPKSAAKSKTLRLLSLRHNKLFGPLGDWDAPALEALLLNDNALEGGVSESLARLPRLGTLRLEGNRLDGNLLGFARALPKGGADAGGASALFYADFSRNRLTGPLPQELSRLGAFAPDARFVAATPAGPLALERGLNVSENALDGAWPDWLLSAQPQAALACGCAVKVRVRGRDMRLRCPRGVTRVTDLYWSAASQQGYTCWTGRREVPLTDYLTSPNNELAPGDVEGPMFGDSPPAPPLRPGAAAGVAIAAAAVAAALGCALYFVGYKRCWLERRARRFERFDGGGGPGGGGRGGGLDDAGLGGGGGGVVSSAGGGGFAAAKQQQLQGQLPPWEPPSASSNGGAGRVSNGGGEAVQMSATAARPQ